MTTVDDARTGLGVVLVGLPAEPAAARAAAGRYAARGYGVAIVELAPEDDIDAGLALIDAARSELLAAGYTAIAVAGYEDGGRFAYLAVTRLAVAGAVAYRGTGIADHLDEARYVKAPLSLHFADDDPRLPLAGLRAVKGALEGFGTVEIYRYPTFDSEALKAAERRAFVVLDGLRAGQG
jgi:dienelactone hydrolase